MGSPDFSSEEMQRYIERQKKKLEEQLAALTPEERADAEKTFAAMREADDAVLRKTLEDARKVMEMNTVQEHHIISYPGAYVPQAVQNEAEKSARFCPNCGAKADGCNFCGFCGTSLKTQ